MKNTIWLVSVAVCLAWQLESQILHVPESYNSINEAISSASHGDTILVNQGVYFENISFEGKNIVLTSYYLYTRDFEDIQHTVINGSLAENPDTASCVMFYSGEDSTAVLEGFTITQGTGTKWVDPQFPSYTWRSGGGIFIFQSSPTVINNLIINNDVSDESEVDGASGGGICTYGGNPFICNNLVWKNTARYGAGVVIDYSGCTFKNNLVAWNIGGSAYGGGGFWMIGNGAAPILLENNTIVNNEAVENGLGGAMYLWSTQLTVRNNIIWGNIQSAGGQIYMRSGAFADVTYSDVEGGMEGDGNIDVDPLFNDSIFMLKLDSPCIDKGNPDTEFNDPEDPANPGFARWPGLGTIRNDMGAYGGQGCLNLGIDLVGVYERPANGELNQFNVQLSPNPFSNKLILSYQLDEPARVSITFFDNNGRRTGDLSFDHKQKGSFLIDLTTIVNKAQQWQPGIYYCNIAIGDDCFINKLIKNR